MLDNEYIITNILSALLKTIIRRTEENYSIAAVGAIIKTLESKYEFLKYLKIGKDTFHNEYVKVSSQINYIDPKRIARIIEILFQIIYNDLGEKAGLFFIKEVQNNADYNVIIHLKEQGIDLELIELQQQFLYNRKAKEKKKIGDEKAVDNQSLLGYSLDHVDHWEFDLKNKECLVFDNNNQLLDKININNIVESYIEDHSEANVKKDTADLLELNEKEYQLLKILYSSDVDASIVCSKLDISEQDLNEIIKKLLKYEMLYYISDNELILTDFGIGYIKNKENI
jgi:hypothetical protein